MTRLLLFLGGLTASLPLFALAGAPSEPGPVAVIEVSGILDDSLARFLTATLSEQAGSGVQVAIIQLDSPGATAATYGAVLDLVRDPPLPLAVWVGPAPAQAFGGAGQMVAAAPIRAAAPGSEVGYLLPTIAGREEDEPPPVGPADLQHEKVAVEEPIPGMVEIVEPALAQFVAALDGLTVVVRGSERTLSTVIEKTGPEGAIIRTPVEARFIEPGIGVRALRIGLDPDIAFFLLAFGGAVVGFEFYALGPGVAAAVAGLFLLLGGYAIASLPVRGWAVGACLVGVVLLAWQFQRTIRPGWATAAGMTLLVSAGLGFTNAAPQFGPTWWVTLLSAVSVGFLFVLALPPVSRARLSTPTIGRSHLVGRRGTAGADFADGDGIAVVDGARWRAAAHRESGLRAGDPLVVIGVAGIYLQVDRENKALP